MAKALAHARRAKATLHILAAVAKADALAISQRTKAAPHCHIHLIPRRPGDVEKPAGGVRHLIPGKGHY